MLEEFKHACRLALGTRDASSVLVVYEMADRAVQAGVPREKLEAWSARIAQENRALERVRDLNRAAGELIDEFLSVPDRYRTPARVTRATE